MQDAEAASRLHVDLQSQEILRPSGEIITFELPDSVKQRLLSGLDEISRTLQWEEAILAHEQGLKQSQPWI